MNQLNLLRSWNARDSICRAERLRRSPDLLCAECANILWKKVRKREFSRDLFEVAARWTDPADRKGRALQPYGRQAEQKTLELLEAALSGVPTGYRSRYVALPLFVPLRASASLLIGGVWAYVGSRVALV